MLDLLARLVDKSLVLVEEQRGVARYRLLETVRQYALEWLQVAGELALMRGRHRDWYLALAELAEPELWTADRVRWLDRLDAEHDNLRAALAWCLEDDPQAGVRLAGSLWQYWRVRAHYTEGRGWLDGLLARAPERTVWRLRALLGTGSLAREQGNFGATCAKLEEGLVLGRELGEARYTAWVLRHLGGVLFLLGDRERARAVLEEGHALIQTVGDRHGFGSSLYRLGELAELEGDYRRARRMYEESLAVAREVGERWLITGVLRQLAGVILITGEPGPAQALAEDGLAIARDLGYPRAIAGFQELLGSVAHWRGDLARAAALYEASLALARRHEGAASVSRFDDQAQVVRALAGLGRVALGRGDAARALACLAESLAFRQGSGDRSGVAACRATLALVASRQGDTARAAELLRESLAARRELGERLGIAECLEGLATVASRQSPVASDSVLSPQSSVLVQAAQLLGAADTLRQAIGAPLPPVERPEHEQTLAAARAALGEEAFAAAWAAGAALPLEQTIEAALAETTEA